MLQRGLKFRMNKKNRTNSKKRLTLLYLVVSLLLIFCILFAVVLIAIKGDTFSHSTLKQSSGSSVVIQAMPGEIYDANGTKIAAVSRTYRLIFDPRVLYETEETYPGSFEKTVQLVSEAFHLNTADVSAAFENNKDKSYVRVTGGEELTPEQLTKYNSLVEAFSAEKTENNLRASEKNSGVTKITAKIAGVWFEEEYQREYPLNTTFSKIIGYTTKDATQGLLGLEYSYNDALHGTNGKRSTYIDEDGTTSVDVEEAKDGYNLITSLDANVSKIVQNAIDEFLTETNAKRINVLVMDPNNGEIIAMESDTEYDLNNPSNLEGILTAEEIEDPASSFYLQELYKSNTEALAALSKEDQLSQLIQQIHLNYQVSGTFEPGSTAKTLCVAAAFEEDVINRSDIFHCDGEIGVEEYTIHCHNDEPCGDLQAIEALGKSCNVCLTEIAEKVGANLFAKYQEIFNIGQKTGIDLPGEANTKNLIYYEGGLGEIELATCSFGQGFNVTMVELASAYASIFNGGYYYEPHIVTQIQDTDGNVIQEINPILVRRTVSEETAAYLRECLNYVTVKGTATSATTFGYSIGGKTGAAEKLPRGTGKYIVSFIGASAAEDPDFLVYVLIDEPDVEDQSMSLPAQQLAKKVFDGLYSYFGVYSKVGEDAYGYDWRGLGDYSAASDSQGTDSFISDPNGLFQWLENTEIQVNPDDLSTQEETN